MADDPDRSGLDPGGRPLRVLHLEDSTNDAELVAAALASDGLICDLRRVETREAFVAALADPFDLILADFALPSFDGARAQALARDRQPATPFIFVSGTLGEDVATERLKSGATDYVLKHHLARLPRVVRRALLEAAERAARERAQEEIRQLNADLERRVTERTLELAAANRALRLAKEEAESANHAKSDFLSRMSHDLRTPLNAILGFAQLLELEQQDEASRDHVAQILQAGRHLLGLINEVLDIARIEAGQLPLSPEPVDVAEVAGHVLALIRPIADEQQVALVDRVAADGTHVMADRQRLRQVLLNLLSNAVKYNRSGGTVTVSAERSAAGRVRLLVADTGRGLPPEYAALLFRPFERLGAEQTDIEGTGLGLALSKGLTELMGGTIGATSTPGVGSTFWIELACVDAPAAGARDAAAVAPRPARATTSGTVLYIEDNSSNVRLFERIVRHRPAVQLLTAAQGARGLELAIGHQPDLIFLDLHLPDMNGEDVLHRLWAEDRTRRIPVIVLSADALPAQSRRLLAAGATGYLTKPFEIARVLELLDEVLSARTSD
ncbi:MAG: response regulator [Acidobacteriota bacterium]|nr:response regulator [Acidobacteriota bacterium]